MDQKPVFASWTAELDYYALTLREMKGFAFPQDEDSYIRSSRAYLVKEILAALRYIQDKGLYKEYTSLRQSQ